MPINVEWQDEDGTTLAEYGGPFLTADLVDQCPRSSRCLWFIDPYGDTTFNQFQREVLIDELAEFIGSHDQLKARLQPLLEFVTRAKRTHTYLKFIGD